MGEGKGREGKGRGLVLVGGWRGGRREEIGRVRDLGGGGWVDRGLGRRWGR